ncbi:hypothetical protein NGK12_13155 [Raoultella ornithinolytica]|uniref:hypothetical protein n=1 Tax=Raoultella ornithinolytica TaxID=54291 RepID=UPI002DB61CB6|nr:hypothetical protein [Raoultella ornithinolytica]MEB7861508.1 hypothetical protein [Raoultella ornithinolytica]MEB7982837.1 hypothetical protein [Raoultella ornithinolytica]
MILNKRVPLVRLTKELEELALKIRGFETPEQARKEREFRIASLSTYTGARYKALCAKLTGCHPKYPCNSAACPECRRGYRLQITREVLRLCSKTDKWRNVTLIFYQDAFTDAEAPIWSPDALIARLRRWLKECGFRYMVIGGFEMDYHTDTGLWLPHFHLITFNEEEALNKLRNRMKNKRNMSARKSVISRPMFDTGIDNPEKQISYLFKTIWWRVESYKENKLVFINNKSIKPKRRTIKRRLRPKQHAHSLVMMDKQGIQTLTFMYKVRKYGDHLILK